jgi:cytochrome oxidase assembly protein ShyY1
LNAQRSRGGLLVPAAFALAALAVLLGLGTWQIERKAWKEALIASLTQRLAATPVALPPPDEWARLTPANSEFIRVRLRGEFRNTDDALVYTGGSALRDDVKSPGYFVFAPVRLPDGRQVAVNRGYVPGRSYPRAAGVQDIVGAVRWPEPQSWFVSAHDAAGAIWHVRDQRLMAQVRNWGPVAPFYIEQEAPVPPGGLPHPSPLTVRLRNDHLQYAMTWYGLAAVLVVMCAIWAVRRRREGPLPGRP